jgi:hypothetical protein
MAARLSALRAGRTSPPGFFIFKDSWYSFLLEAESTPGPSLRYCLFVFSFFQMIDASGDRLYAVIVLGVVNSWNTVL